MNIKYIFKVLLGSTILLAICCSAAFAADWYVDGKKGRDTNPGTSKKPFQTIQRGIDAAAPSGDTVYVSLWTYMENLVVDTKEVTLTGSGMTGTIIDGESNGHVIQVVNGATLALSGFTLRNGTESTLHNAGGGIYAEAATIIVNETRLTENHVTGGPGGAVHAYRSSVTISNSVITNNSADGAGALQLVETNSWIENSDISYNVATSDAGAIGNGAWGSIDLINNSISYNQGVNGGAIRMGAYGNHRLTGNRFIGNTASNNGGALYATGYAGVILIDNVIEANTAASQGGGMCVYNSSVTADGNILRNNDAGFAGGGYWHGGQGLSFMDNLVVGNTALEGAGLYGTNIGPFLSNNTFVDNIASVAGAGVVITNPGTRIPRITNSILWGNLANGIEEDLVGFLAANITNNDISDGSFCGQNGNICVDPLFAPADQDFHLQDTSPCRDAGLDPNGIYLATDYEGDPRRVADGGDGVFDIGADEYTEYVPPVCTDNDGDGWTDCDGDCDDTDPAINPGMDEKGKHKKDGIDNDCNGIIDG